MLKKQNKFLKFGVKCYNKTMTRNTVIVFLFVIFSFYFFNLKGEKVLAVDCGVSSTIVSESDKSYCQNELNKLLKEQAELEAQLKEQGKKTGTLKGDVTALTAQINALKAKVKSRTLVIAQLKNSIKQKVSAISSLSQKIEREHESLAQLLRNTNEFDNENIVHLILSDSTISSYYNDLESYASIKQAVKDSVEKITGIKVETEVQKKDLEVKQDAELDAKAELENTQKKVAQTEAEKKQLLAISKQKENDYQKLVAEKRAKADRIRSALFPLAGISKKIEFGVALSYANDAKQKFGIDPAFLLAIFTQESNLGANVGQCYVTDTITGNGKGANTGSPQIRVMSPTRDIPTFLEITNKLGISYSSTRVSCWIKAYKKDGSSSGWGGAMGPAQFIPSTWKIFESRLKSILGHEASPWEPRDAFMASSMYLTDLGAIGTSTSAQSRAACKYYGSGGATCGYSKSVMNLKNKIQVDIDYMNEYGTTR